jgi:hypothetical protein
MNDASDTGPVFRLIYSSHSRIAPEDRDELGAIFTAARRNNKRLGVTGALIVGDGTFAQALEGEETVVRALYGQICRDERHDHVVEIDATTVLNRTFGRWAMAKVAVDGGPDIRLLSNAQHGKIVDTGSGLRVTTDQESVLAVMRSSITGALSA